MDLTESTKPEPTAPARDDYAVTVLLVDDQAMVGEAIRRALLDQPNLQFRFCAKPLEALALAQQLKPTVILQDLIMPGVDGLELVRQYRANATTKDTPIIVLSTKEEPAVKSEAFALGANDYLIKLPDKVELIARVRYHSKSYLNQIQRDEAYGALRESQQKLTEINSELQRLNRVDGLTGVSNRAYFNEYIEREWRRAKREQALLSVLMIDVDNFKRYNDTYGHLAGDEVLKKVGAAIRDGATRPADFVARFGGEEFVALLPVTPAEGARHVGRRICNRVFDLQVAHSASDVTPYVTISVGGATLVPQTGSETFLNLLELADQALYDAKRAGKNQAVVREPQ
jgi:two-component system chemotaxis family response regulator WspR